MIKVLIKKNNNLITDVSITGHASYDDYGKDIVCAAVSSIAITTINAIVRIDSEAIFYKDESGYLTLKVLKEDEVISILLFNMIELLKELKMQYPKNIKINEEVSQC